MSTMPRTPRHYPRMKVRGAGRKRAAGFHRLYGALDGLSVEAQRMAATMDNFAHALAHATPEQVDRADH